MTGTLEPPVLDVDPAAVGRLIADLEAMGVLLWLDGGELRYRAPKGVMTPQRLDLVRAHRAGIVATLTAGLRPGQDTDVSSVGAPSLTSDAASRYEPFPLTDVQTAYLVGRADGHPYGGVGCHGYGELRFDDVDPTGLDRAWSQLIRRHDMLRAVVHPDGTQQVLARPPAYSIAVDDHRGRTPAEFAAAVAHTRAAMDHRVYTPGLWPLFDLRLSQHDDHTILHFSIDFLIADFVSLHVLVEELEQEYRHPTRGAAEPQITFRDVFAATRADRAGTRFARDAAYWADRMPELPDRPDLPVSTVDQRPARFERLVGGLSATQWTALTARARRSRLTPTAAVLAAYAEVIGRWSRGSRFTLNVTVLNRPPGHPDIGRIVGDFTTVELLAVDSSFDQPFSDRARRLQARLWEDLDHGLYTGIDVVRELRRRNPDAPSLFPVVFTSGIGLRREPDLVDAGAAEPTGMRRLGYGVSQTPQVWLDCQVMETPDGLAVNWDVRAAVFPDGLVETMFAAFRGLLHQLAAGDDVWAADCPVGVPVAQLDRRPIPQPPAATDGLLHEQVLAQAGRTPDRIAVIAGARSFTYADLVRRAAAVARMLRGDQCPPGTVVAVEMDKGAEQVVAVLGIVAAGCAYLPVDTGQPVARRDRIIADAGVRLVLTQPWLLDSDRRPGVRTVPVDVSAEPDDGPDLSFDVGPDDLAYVIYTSGSTGTPKGVMTSHRAAWNTIADINDRFGIGPDDRVLGLANLGFDLSVYDVFGPLSVGGALVLPTAARRGDPGHWAELVEDHQISVWNSVPGQLEMLVSYLAGEPGLALDPLRLALCSGDWIPVTLPGAAWRRLPGLRVVSLGGATEASIWSIAHDVSTVDDSAPSIPYGRPLRGQTVEVLGPGLVAVPDLVAGELYIGGVGLALGYLNDPVRTEDRFIRHPTDGRRLYRTGDLGRYLPDGCVELLGRDDAQVKIRGYRVELAEVEAVLAAYPPIAAAAVITVGTRPDPVRLAAFVEPATVPASATEGSTVGSTVGSARVTGGGPSARELAAAAVRASSALRERVDDDQMLTFARELDATALSQMVVALRDSRLFATTADAHTLAEILQRAEVAPAHHRLVRRWLRALVDNDLVSLDPVDGRYRRTADVGADTVREGWDRVDASTPAVEHRTELITYFRTAGSHLPQLLRGEVDPLGLLFPQGRTDIHENAYTGLFLSQFVNRLLTSAAVEIASRHRGPLRVLEVGAGVGGTSVELIAALRDFDVRYEFTDVSEFFLNNARSRFADYSFVDYRLFDLNADYRSQAMTPNSYEVIVCANVLHYAKNADQALVRLRELLRPGGWLLFIEATRDSYQIMTSMEFLFDEGSGTFTDAREPREQTFLTRAQWMDALRAAGADQTMCLPPDDPITEAMGMHVFGARFKSDRSPVRRAELEAFLVEQLPAYMLPSWLQVVDLLPVTDNGKVDRAALRGWLPASASDRSPSGPQEPPEGELEEQLAEVWRRLLRVDRVGRHQNFFALGGDSLVAAQVATEIRAAVPAAAGVFYDNVLRLLLENSTVASLAARIASLRSPAVAAASTGAMSPLVEIGEGTGPTVVLVHDGTGGLAGYRPLLDVLGYATRIVGLRVVDPAAYLDLSPATLVDDVAGGYARALVAAGHERLCLVGQHFGGILAAEIARQVGEVGVPVHRLVVIAPLPTPTHDELVVEYLFYRTVGVDPESVGFPATLAGPEAAARLARLRAQPRRERLEAAAASVPTIDPLATFDIFRHSQAAGADLLPYAGSITLVRPGRSAFAAVEGDVVEYWREVALGDLDVLDVAADEFAGTTEAAALLSTLLGTDPVADCR